jgi:transposase
MKLYNDKLSDLRRDLYHEATTKLQKDVLKGTRWLLLNNPENLDRAKREPQRLREALALNESLATAHSLKESLSWLQQHRAGLLNWYRSPNSTGPLEGVSNKIQTLKRPAYGYRDLEFFRLIIYARHMTKCAFVG